MLSKLIETQIEADTDMQELSKMLTDWAITEPELSLILGNVRRIRNEAIKTSMELAYETGKAEERERVREEISNALWNPDGSLKSHDLSEIVSVVIHKTYPPQPNPSEDKCQHDVAAKYCFRCKRPDLAGSVPNANPSEDLAV
jgi:hypothetical protein